MTSTPRELLEKAPGRHTPPARRRRLPTLRLSAPASVLAVGLLVQAVITINFAQQYWFAGDDWDMLFTRGIIPGESRGLWDAHNGHVSVLMALVYRGVFEVFGMKSYLPYAMLTIVLHLALSVLWYQLLKRVGAPPWPAVIGAWLLLFLGAGGDALMVSAAVNHLGSLIAAVGAVYVLARSEVTRGALVTAAALCVVSAMFSNTGVAAVFFVAMYAVIARTLRVAVVTVAPAALAYLTWYLSAGGQATAQFPADPWDYLQTPQLAWQILTGAMGNAVGVAAMGPALLIALVAVAVFVSDVPGPLRQLMWAGLLAAVFQAMVLGLSRQWLDPTLGRYSYLAMAFLVPAAVVCTIGISRVSVEPAWIVGVVTAVALASYAVTGTLALRKFHEDWLYLSRPWPERVAGMLQAVDAGERQLTSYGGDPFNSDVNPEFVSAPVIRDALPELVAGPTSRLDMETSYMTAVGTDSVLPLGSDGVHQFEGSFVGEVRNSPGCQTLEAKSPTPVIIVGTGNEGSEITVTSQSTTVKTQLVRGSLSSGSREWPAQPGTTVHVSTTAKSALLFITLDGAGSYVVCT